MEKSHDNSDLHNPCNCSKSYTLLVNIQTPCTPRPLTTTFCNPYKTCSNPALLVSLIFEIFPQTTEFLSDTFRVFGHASKRKLSF